MKRILIITYILLLFLWIIFSYLFIDPNLIYFHSMYTGFSFHQRGITTLVYIFLLVSHISLYLFFIYSYRKKEISPMIIKKLICISAAVLFFAYPAMLSYDIFNYIATAKVTFFYRENPYIIMPIEFLHDPLLLFTHATNKVALYGPLWIVLTAVPFLLGLNNFIVTLFLFKAIPLVFYSGTCWLLHKLSKNWLSVLLFGLHPLVLIETILSGHNDIVMMFLALSAFYFLKKKKNILSFVFILLSIFIKYATIFLIPVYMYTQYIRHSNKSIQWEKIFFWSAIAMGCIFLLSPLREEIYPWYAVWFLPFVFLVPHRRFILWFSLVLSFSLLFRYVPFMYFVIYDVVTKYAKIALTGIPIGIFLIWYFLRKYLF